MKIVPLIFGVVNVLAAVLTGLKNGQLGAGMKQASTTKIALSLLLIETKICLILLVWMFERSSCL